jgi:hypothetical protein
MYASEVIWGIGEVPPFSVGEISYFMNEFQVLLMYSFKQLQWLLILAMKRSL